MRMGFELNLEQTQKLVMTPELQQAIAILQLSAQELTEYIEEQLVENPILELKEDSQEDGNGDNSDGSTEKEEFDIDWQEYFQDESDLGYVKTPREKKEEVVYDNFLSEAPTLQEHLLLQFQLIVKSDMQEKIGEFIIGNLDGNGYLCTSIAEIAQYFQVDIRKVEEALKLVQSLDPTGVGARNLQECLLLQVRSRGLEVEYLETLINNYLPELADGKLNKVAKLLDIDVKKVQEVMDIIKTLDPKPGRWFASGDSVRYIVPDVVVEKVGDEYVVLINDVSTPRLGINPMYRALMKEGAKCDPDTKKFIEGKLNAASWIIKSIEQRRMTLYKVVNSIINFQKEFFEKGIKGLKPLNLKQIAEEIELHESTVSRTICNKYIQTPQGVFPLKFFFASGVGNLSGSLTSSHSIKKLIQEYINEEDQKKPYTDQQLTNMLKSQGIKISRRTVAKYRDEMGIPSTSRRKRY